MEITNVRIRKTFETGTMKAIASVTLDDALALHDIKLIDVNGRLFIVMPSRRMADGSFKDTCHPINADFRKRLEAAIIEAYEAEGENF